MPLDLQFEDAVAVIADLSRRPLIDAARIGLWGFSQGAWVAPLAASRTPKIAFLVLLASTGVTPAEQMLYGTARHVRDAGFADDAVQSVVTTRRLVDDWRRGSAPLERAQLAVDRLARHPWFEHAYLPRDLSAAGEWADMDFDPEPIFAGVRVPTLLFYGEDDEWSPIDASVATWQRAAARAGNRDVSIVRLEGTRHAPTLGGGDDDAISPDYERVLVDWLVRVLGLAS